MKNILDLRDLKSQRPGERILFTLFVSITIDGVDRTNEYHNVLKTGHIFSPHGINALGQIDVADILSRLECDAYKVDIDKSDLHIATLKTTCLGSTSYSQIEVVVSNRNNTGEKIERRYLLFTSQKNPSPQIDAIL